MSIHYRLSQRAKALRLSPIRKVLVKADEAKRRGIMVTDLSAGRPDFDTPAYIIKAAKKAMDEGFVQYTASAGIRELQEAILFDTDFLVDFFRGHSIVAAFLNAHSARIILSPIVVGELYAGVKGDAEQLREPQNPYIDHFGVKKSEIDPINAYVWD